MGDTFNERLFSLESEFIKAGQRFSGLMLDLLADQRDRPITQKGWKAFVKHNGGESRGEKEWDIFPDARFLGRFYGNVKGYLEFQALAAKAYRLLCETDPTLNPQDSYHGWLGVIYEIAFNCPTPDVDFELTLWDYDDTREYDGRVLSAHVKDEKGEKFPAHPYRMRFKNCLFRTAAAVLQLFYAPHRTKFLCDGPYDPPVHLLRQIRIVPWQLCAVICNNVSLMERTAEEIAKSGIRDAVLNLSYRSDELFRPRFIEGPDGSGELMLGGQKLRKVDSKAKLLRPVLREFERQGWPPSIANPVKHIDAPHKVRSFHTQMNLHQEGPYRIEFKVVNNGERITWRIVKAIQLPSRQDGGEQQGG